MRVGLLLLFFFRMVGERKMLYHNGRHLSRGSAFQTLLVLAQAGLDGDFDILPMKSIVSSGLSPVGFLLGESDAGVFGKTNQNIKDILGGVVSESLFSLLKGQSMGVELAGVGEEAVKFPLVLEHLGVDFAHRRFRHSLVFLHPSMTFRQ